MEFRIIIPARYDSVRLPGKVLLDIGGKPMIQYVYEKAVSSGAESVVIATDDERIAAAAESFGAPFCMTSANHPSGTERICEAVAALEYEPDDIVIGLQADEPLISQQVISQLASTISDHENVKVGSMCEQITNVDDLFDPNVVKVVLNRRHFAMYFSRAPIPWDRGTFPDKDKIELNQNFYRHIGLYGYRVSFLEDYMNWSSCPVENIESLEQLKILWNGGRILMSVVNHPVSRGVDCQEDLEAVRKKLGKAKNKV